MRDTGLPDDVYTESRCRLPPVERDRLPEGAKEIYDYLNDSAGGSLTGLQGPGGVRLHSPRLAELSRPVARYLRHETGLSPREREVAILVTARELDSRFEWQQHEGVARLEGVPAETIEAIKHDLPVRDGIDAPIVETGRQLFREHRLDGRLFAQLRERYGEQRLIDLISIMGSYAATAVLLAAVDMRIPSHEEPLLPMP